MPDSLNISLLFTRAEPYRTGMEMDDTTMLSESPLNYYNDIVAKICAAWNKF
jgi:hypothetical protein